MKSEGLCNRGQRRKGQTSDGQVSAPKEPHLQLTGYVLPSRPDA